MQLTRELQGEKKIHKAKDREISESLWHQQQYLYIWFFLKKVFEFYEPMDRQ